MAGKKIPPRTVPGGPALGAEALRFIQEGEPTAEPSTPSAQPPKRSSTKKVATRAVIERADGRILRKMNIYFNVDTATRLRLHCAREDIDMSAYVEALVDKELKRLNP